MMEIPQVEWLIIEDYRDFYDWAHLIIARAASGARWLLDSKFNDAMDAYQSSFSV